MWAEKNDGSRLSMTEMEEGEINPSEDFTGLWKRSDFDPETGKAKFNPHYKPPKNWPLTQLGRELVDNFHEDQNPMVNCGNPGPPIPLRAHTSIIAPPAAAIGSIQDPTIGHTAAGAKPATAAPANAWLNPRPP